MTAKEEQAAEAEKEANKAQRMLSMAGLRVGSPIQDASLSASNSWLFNPSSSSNDISTGISPGKRRSRGGGGSSTPPKGPPRYTLLRFLASTDVVRDQQNAVVSNTNGEIESPGEKDKEKHAKGDTATPGVIETSEAEKDGTAEKNGTAKTAQVEPQVATAIGVVEDVVPSEGGGGDEEAGATGAIAYGRGDLVEFSVVARRGQRQQQQQQTQFVGNVSLLAKGALPCR